MNAFALARYNEALHNLDVVISDLEDGGSSWHRQYLVKVRGELVAMRQLLDLEETMGEAKTDPAGLRLVK